MRQARVTSSINRDSLPDQVVVRNLIGRCVEHAHYIYPSNYNVARVTCARVIVSVVYNIVSLASLASETKRCHSKMASDRYDAVLKTNRQARKHVFSRDPSNGAAALHGCA